VYTSIIKAASGKSLLANEPSDGNMHFLQTILKGQFSVRATRSIPSSRNDTWLSFPTDRFYLPVQREPTHDLYVLIAVHLLAADLKMQLNYSNPKRIISIRSSQTESILFFQGLPHIRIISIEILAHLCYQTFWAAKAFSMGTLE
jgi:hypothetical protein